MQDDGGGGARIGLLEIGIAGGAVGLSIVVQVCAKNVEGAGEWRDVPLDQGEA